MRRVNLHPVEAGVDLVVSGHATPGLRMEVASGRRMLLRQPRGPVLFGAKAESA